MLMKDVYNAADDCADTAHDGDDDEAAADDYYNSD